MTSPRQQPVGHRRVERRGDPQANHVRIAVGGEDSLLERNRNYHELLGRLKIEHGDTVVPGVGHDSARLYEKLGDAAFAFYQRRR